MINIKRLSIIASLFILIGGIGSLLTYRSANKQIQVADTKIFNDQNVSSMQIETDNGGIEIVPTKESAIKVEVSGIRKTDQAPSFSADVKGTTLFIKLNNQNQKWVSIDFSFEPLTLKVYLPEKKYEFVKVKTNNGSIKLNHILATLVNVESDNGGILLDHVDGKLSGKTLNGAITVMTKDLDRPVELSSDNGSLTIQTEKEPTNATFNAHSDNGHIELFHQNDPNRVMGKGENQIRLTTKNGAITVTKMQ